MSGSHRKTIIGIGFALGLVLLVLVALATYHNEVESVESRKWVVRTHQVIEGLQDVFSLLQDEETGQRGYIITGQDSYLTPYMEAVAQISEKVNELRKLTADNAGQQARLRELQLLVEKKLAELQNTISLRKNMGFEAALQAVLTDDGKRIMDEIRERIKQMKKAEENLLVQREEMLERDLSRRRIGLFSLAIAALGFLLLSSFLAHRGAVRTPTEEALRDSRARLAAILDAMPQSIFWKNRDGVYMGCNKVFAKVTGVESPDQIIGKTDYDLPWPRAEADAYRADDEDVISRNQPKEHIIEPAQQGNGTRIWVDTTKVPLTDGTGKPYGVLGVFDDITERKRTEEALREREDSYRNLFREMMKGFARNEIICDSQGRPINSRYLAVNPAFERITGLKAEAVVGKTILEVFPSLEPHWIEIFGKVALTGEAAHFESFAAELGIWFEVTAFCPAPNQYACTFSDITDRKRAEEALDYLNGEGDYSDRATYPLPDIVLLDLKLPRIDGFEVLRRTKGTLGLRRLPVIILTSSEEEGDRALGYDCGGNSYLVKPVSFEGFLKVVRQLGEYWLILNVAPPET